MGSRMFLTVIFLSFIGCLGPKSPPVDEEDAMPMDDASDICSKAQRKLEALKCAEARTPEGKPFADVCRIAMFDGRNWRPDCLSQITACSQISAAYRVPTGVKCK